MSGLDDSKMPLLDHLIELRRRLLWSAISLAVAFGVCFYFAPQIFEFLTRPLVASGGTNLNYYKMFEAFFSQMKVAFFAAMMLSFPVFATQIWKFVAPGLYRNEKKAFLPFLLLTPVLFTLGAALAYYVAMPVAIRFLLSFSGNIGSIEVEALPGIGDYLDFSTKFIFGFGVAFLLPVVLMLLERAGLVTRQQLKSGRRYAIVGAFALAAVLTPPDVLSQLLLAIPLVLLYEFALVAIWITHWRQGKQSVNDSAAETDTATG